MRHATLFASLLSRRGLASVPSGSALTRPPSLAHSLARLMCPLHHHSHPTNNSTTTSTQTTRTTVTSAAYRTAILRAMEELRDYHSRSSVDRIRRRCLEIFDERGYVWSEGAFWQTIKALKEEGDIRMVSYSMAELSPSLKKKIVDFCEHRLVIDDPNVGETKMMD